MHITAFCDTGSVGLLKSEDRLVKLHVVQCSVHGRGAVLVCASNQISCCRTSAFAALPCSLVTEKRRSSGKPWCHRKRCLRSSVARVEAEQMVPSFRSGDLFCSSEAMRAAKNFSCCDYLSIDLAARSQVLSASAEVMTKAHAQLSNYA